MIIDALLRTEVQAILNEFEGSSLYPRYAMIFMEGNISNEIIHGFRKPQKFEIVDAYPFPSNKIHIKFEDGQIYDNPNTRVFLSNDKDQLEAHMYKLHRDWIRRREDYVNSQIASLEKQKKLCT